MDVGKNYNVLTIARSYYFSYAISHYTYYQRNTSNYFGLGIITISILYRLGINLTQCRNILVNILKIIKKR